MSDHSDWFKVARKVFSHPIADDKPWDRLSAWLYLISLAAHDDYTTIIRQHEYPLKRGRLAISLGNLAEKTGWTVKECRTFLAWLRKHEMIKRFSDHASTFILITNYDKWQGTAEGIDEGTEEGTAQTSSEQTEEDKQGTEEGTATGIANGTPSEEKFPLASPLEKKSRRSSTKEPPTPKKGKTFKIPHLTFNRETLTVEGFDDKARAYAATFFPNKDLDKAFHSLLEWIVKKDPHYQNYWKSYITFCSGMPDEVVTRFNSGALKGQIYRVDHSAGQVQQNKRPEPVMDLSKVLRKD